MNREEIDISSINKGAERMKCKDCENFHIRQEPLPHHYDTGLAECKKHHLVIDFYNHGKINRLECVEEQEE